MPIEVVAGHRLQVGLVTDDFVMVRVYAEGSRLDRLAQLEKRFIFIALALRDHDRPFGFELLGIVNAIDHAVGFQS